MLGLRLGESDPPSYATQPIAAERDPTWSLGRTWPRLARSSDCDTLAIVARQAGGCALLAQAGSSATPGSPCLLVCLLVRTMPGRSPAPPRGQAVVWLATTFVLLAGLVGCTIIAVSADAGPREILLASGPIAALAALFVWLAQGARPRNRHFDPWGWLRRPSQTRVKLEFQRRPPGPPPDAAPHQPPSVEQVRELGQSLNTWVPAATARPQPRSLPPPGRLPDRPQRPNSPSGPHPR